RLEKIKRYVADPLKVSCTFSVHKFNQIAQFEVVLRNGLQLHASESTENMYSSVDLALAKMERQVRRYKKRIKHHKQNEGRSAKVRLNVIAAENDTDEIALQQPEETPASVTPIDGGPTIVHTKEFQAERLTPDQAIMQMNLMHKAFWVFTNPETEQINVVYRLEDGETYGLIQPEPSAETAETG
ncbi:MAG: ribosome-associated translation inhibitor RaiA, partial [Myxococcales bacterium]|nr:ribosome-associated translation inhibitor RaiA [Myxococcales bacterium]